jgi:hypothetical protein
METAALIAWGLSFLGGIILFGMWAARGGMRTSDLPGTAPPPVEGRRTETRFTLAGVIGHITLAVLGLIFFISYISNSDSDEFAMASWFSVVFIVLAAATGLLLFLEWLDGRRADKEMPGTEETPEHRFPTSGVVFHGVFAVAVLVLSVLVAFKVGT